jgi:hypothetical protein
MKGLLIFPSLVLTIAVAGQGKNEELIRWNDGQKLTWADYKGKPKENSDAAASTATYLGFEFNIGQNGFDYKITCTFSKTKSWGLHKTEYILTHEQGHFDIAEIFARKLNKTMREYKFDKETFKEDLKIIYQSIALEKDAFQNQYDEETNHSIKREKQAEWLKKIGDQLQELAQFSDY